MTINTEPFFTIVIPALNEEKNMPKILGHLAKQTERSFEVVVVDSGSKDKTAEEAAKFASTLPKLNFQEHPCRNVSMARNYGASLAKTPFLVFFDADVEMAEDFLEKTKDKLTEKKLDAMTVWNRPQKDSLLPGKVMLGIANLAMTLFQGIKPGANGPCIVISRDMFNKIKGFDESIVFGEDFDLIQRAFKLGARFAVYTRPLVYVSTRRFDKEGLVLSTYKSLKALVYQLFVGPIRKPIFNYQMGGQYYESPGDKK